MTEPTLDKTAVGDGPSITEDQWYKAAIYAGVISIIFVIVAAMWIFCEPSLSEKATKVSILAPFGTALLALVTLFTVAWRGMVTSRQADQQKRQNDATEDANYAKLLQEGTKLLADEKTPNQLAGIASLRVLLDEPRSRYKSQALEVLAESVANMYARNLDGPNSDEVVRSSTFRMINKLLENETSSGRYTDVSIKFRARTGFGVPAPQWPTVYGFNRCEFSGGVLEDNLNELITHNKELAFVDVTISESIVENIDKRFVRCRFLGSSIKYFSSYEVFTRQNLFENCNFTDCKFPRVVNPRNMDSKVFPGCFYDVMSPPHHPDFTEWQTLFEPRMLTEAGWEKLADLRPFDDHLSDDQKKFVEAFYKV